jgi:hypothetical protein
MRYTKINLELMVFTDETDDSKSGTRSSAAESKVSLSIIAERRRDRLSCTPGEVVIHAVKAASDKVAGALREIHAMDKRE